MDIEHKLENKDKALHIADVTHSFKWKRTTYCSLPPYTRIEEESEDEDGNKILSFWDKNKTPNFQTHYKGDLINSSNKKDFGRAFGTDLVSHLFKLHKDAKYLILNCG